MMALSQRGRAELALAAVTVLWGATFVVVKNGIEHASTLLFIAMRFTIGAVALGFLFRKQLLWQPHLRPRTVTGGMLAGGCLVTAYFFQTLGLRYTTPSKSAFITGLTAALVPFLGALVYKKAPHLSEGIGVMVATAGLALLTLPAGRLAVGYGDALTLGCTVAFAWHILILARWAPVSSFELLSFLQLAVTALLAWLVCGLVEAPRVVWHRELLWALGITGLLSTALAFTVMAWAQRHTSPARAALILTLEPVSAAVTSYLAEGEVLMGRAFLGAALILGGLLVVELKPVGSARHPLN